MFSGTSLKKSILNILQEVKREDDNQDEPFYKLNTEDSDNDSESKKKKPKMTDSDDSNDNSDDSNDNSDGNDNSCVSESKKKSEKTSYDDCEYNMNDQSYGSSNPTKSDSVNEISQYNKIVTFLRSKGLDPYKISPEQRALWKQSPQYKSWVRSRYHESYDHKSAAIIVKEIYRKKLLEDLLDRDKLNKDDATFGKTKVEKGTDYNNKEKDSKGSNAEVVMTRDKTLTGKKEEDCNIVEINPKLNSARLHQYADKDRSGGDR